MPVVHLTVHAFGTWTEDHPRGFIQRGQGLQPPNPRLHHARRRLQSQPAVAFDADQRSLLDTLFWTALEARACTPHGSAITPTHGHFVFSYPHPLCTCGARERARRSPGNVSGAAAPKIFCRKTCESRAFADAFARRVKKDAGMALATHAHRFGQKWFSRGWDLTPVWTPDHLHHLLTSYLPNHTPQQGLVRIAKK